MIRKINLIAIDPGHREFGYAHFEGDELVDYGVKSLRRHRPARNPLVVLKSAIQRFIVEKNPDIMVIEKNSFGHINQNQPVMKVIAVIRRIAAAHAVPVAEFAPNTVRKEICGDGRATKGIVSKIISSRFPELTAYRESNRKWRERYYHNMFDAVACGLTYIKLHGKEINPAEQTQ